MAEARRLAVGLVTALAVLATACGGDFQSPSSPTASGSPASSGGARITGKVKGWGLSATAPSTLASTTGATVTVTVVGTNISTTVSVTGNFVLDGVPSGTIQLQFSSAGTTATTTITGVSTEQIDITVELNGSSAVIVRIERAPMGSPNSPPPSGGSQTVEGAITSISHGDRSMKINGLEIKIWDAPIYQGSQRVGIRLLSPGMRVRVKGNWVHDYIVATEVTIL